MPPNSCIFVDDFAGNMSALADYLHYLDKNATAYRQYLQWRLLDVEEVFGHDLATADCQLCRIINGINVEQMHSTAPAAKRVPLFGIRRRTVDSLRDWSYDQENVECFK